MNHTGKVALVTGAASGIGAAIALRLASDGADLILGDISDAIQLQAKEIISKTGRNVVWGKVDVGDFASCSNFIESSMKNLGSKSVDILVNNAGINRDALFLKMTYEQWDSVIKVDLYSMFNMTKQLAQAMVDKGYGRIINISSMSWLGNIGQANYAAAKAGVIGFTKTLARELAKYNITVNAICPGFIDTPMTRAVPEKIRSIMLEKIPMKRIGDPKDVAALVSFLASEEFPDKYALSYFKHRLTYSELDSISDSIASQLSEYVRKGDTVAILLQNIPQFVMVQHAVWKLGCTLLPINPSYSPREIRYCLSDSNAKLAITQADALDRVLEASKGLKNKVISTNPTTFSDIPAQVFEKWGFKEGSEELDFNSKDKRFYQSS